MLKNAHFKERVQKETYCRESVQKKTKFQGICLKNAHFKECDQKNSYVEGDVK